MEREYIPWEAALRSLSSLFAVFDRNEVYGPMQVGSLKTSINSALILLSVTVYIFVLLGLLAKTGQASVWSFYFCSCKLDDGACRPHWSVKIYTILKFFSTATLSLESWVLIASLVFSALCLDSHRSSHCRWRAVQEYRHAKTSPSTGLDSGCRILNTTGKYI